MWLCQRVSGPQAEAMGARITKADDKGGRTLLRAYKSEAKVRDDSPCWSHHRLPCVYGTGTAGDSLNMSSIMTGKVQDTVSLQRLRLRCLDVSAALECGLRVNARYRATTHSAGFRTNGRVS